MLGASAIGTFNTAAKPHTVPGFQQPARNSYVLYAHRSGPYILFTMLQSLGYSRPDPSKWSRAAHWVAGTGVTLAPNRRHATLLAVLESTDRSFLEDSYRPEHSMAMHPLGTGPPCRTETVVGCLHSVVGGRCHRGQWIYLGEKNVFSGNQHEWRHATSFFIFSLFTLESRVVACVFSLYFSPVSSL